MFSKLLHEDVINLSLQNNNAIKYIVPTKPEFYKRQSPNKAETRHQFATLTKN